MPTAKTMFIDFFNFFYRSDHHHRHYRAQKLFYRFKITRQVLALGPATFALELITT